MGCFTDCMKCCSASVMIMALLAASLGISITSVVLGATNLNSNCTGISQIPAYLITTGVLGLVSFLMRTHDDNKDSTEGNKKKENGCLNLIYTAHFGVIIWGSVILFGKPRPDCDTVLYDYAFAITLTAYVVLALFVLFGCCTFSAVFCDACANHCCGDGDGELTYNCHCCGMTLCADEATRAKSVQATAAKPEKATTSIPDTDTTGMPAGLRRMMMNNLENVHQNEVVINMDPHKKTNIGTENATLTLAEKERITTILMNNLKKMHQNEVVIDMEPLKKTNIKTDTCSDV